MEGADSDKTLLIKIAGWYFSLRFFSPVAGLISWRACRGAHSPHEFGRTRGIHKVQQLLGTVSMQVQWRCHVKALSLSSFFLRWGGVALLHFLEPSPRRHALLGGAAKVPHSQEQASKPHSPSQAIEKEAGAPRHDASSSARRQRTTSSSSSAERRQGRGRGLTLGRGRGGKWGTPGGRGDSGKALSLRHGGALESRPSASGHCAGGRRRNKSC